MSTEFEIASQGYNDTDEEKVGMGQESVFLQSPENFFIKEESVVEEEPLVELENVERQPDDTPIETDLNRLGYTKKPDGPAETLLDLLNVENFYTENQIEPSVENFIGEGGKLFSLEDIPTARKIQYGIAQEQTILGNVWDMLKAGVRNISTDETYTEALRNIHQEDIEDVWKEFSEFRGLSVYDEDLTIMAGRMGVALVDPVTFVVPWTKFYTLGKVGTVAAGAAFGAADAALYGHVQHGEVDSSTVSIAAAIGGTAMLASRQLERLYAAKRTRRESARGEAVAAQVLEVLEETKMPSAKPPTTASGPVVVNTPALPKGDTRPMREVVADWERGKLASQNSATPKVSVTTLPANASAGDVARAARKFLVTGKPYTVEKEVAEYITETAETIVNSSGSKYRPDPSVAHKLTQELSDMITLRGEIAAKKTASLNLKGKAKRAAQEELKNLNEQMAKASATHFKNVTRRAIEGNELAFDIFDTAVKEDRLTSSMLRVLMRESVRPAFGAVGGLTFGTLVADEDDDFSWFLGTAVAGAALGRWQSKLQTAKISAMDRDMGDMIVYEGWKNILSINNSKFHTAATAATRLNSLGGVAKILGNIMFDRPGGTANSLETIVTEQTRAWRKKLAGTLGSNASDSGNKEALRIREIAGEVLDGFVLLSPDRLITREQRNKGVVSLTVGYRGLGNRFEKGLSQEEVNVINRIVPQLAKQREELATSVEAVGLNFKRIEDYGMPQIYNYEAIRKNESLFRKILEGQFEGSKSPSKKANALYLKITRQGTKNLEEESIIDNTYRISKRDAKDRPLLNHFEKERLVTDFNVRRELAAHGFIELDVARTFEIYGQKTIKIREFVDTFGPNGEFIDEAFKIVDRAFDGLGSNSQKLRDTYKNYMRGGVNAFFGVHGTSTGNYSVVNKAVQTLVAFTNMHRLVRTGITVSLADFLAPIKANSLTSAAQGIKGRFNKSVPLHQREGLRYDNSFELELSALRAHSNNPLDSFSTNLNEGQKRFFQLTQLQRVTEQAGYFAFDVGAYRAFEIAKRVTKNSTPPTASLKREINELGLNLDLGTSDNLKYLSKFRNAEEAYEDTLGRKILSRAGQKAMDRDRLIPKVGNRLLFTQHRNPLIRNLGQFTSWAQAKTAQTNALVSRIEDGDAKLAMRMLGATVIGNGFLVWWKDFLRPSSGSEEEFSTLENIAAAADMSGDVMPWHVSRLGSSIRYADERDPAITQFVKALSPSFGYASDVLGDRGLVGAWDNLVDDGDWTGAAADIINVIPIANEVNKYANSLFNVGLIDESKRKRSTSFPFYGMSKGGVVNVPQAPTEPDERIDKMTGMPYNIQAGMAFIDDEDPLKRLGFTGGGQVDPLVRLGFNGGSSVEDAITRHHRRNLQGGTYAIDDRGNVATVYTRQVNDPRLNNGAPTLIPSVYNKEVLSQEEAIEKAVESKINWPSAKTHPELRKIDIEIHKPFNQDLEESGIVKKRTAKVLGGLHRSKVNALNIS